MTHAFWWGFAAGCGACVVLAILLLLIGAGIGISKAASSFLT